MLSEDYKLWQAGFQDTFGVYALQVGPIAVRAQPNMGLDPSAHDSKVSTSDFQDCSTGGKEFQSKYLLYRLRQLEAVLIRQGEAGDTRAGCAEHQDRHGDTNIS